MNEDTDQRQERGDEELEDPWLGQDVDPELLELAESRERGNIVQPLLMILVLIIGSYIVSDWRDELSYFFLSEEPIELGNVTDFPTKRHSDPSWTPGFVHNSYVKLEGIPTRRSRSDKYSFFKLVGGQVFVEDEREDYIEDPLKREKARAEETQKSKVARADRTFYSGAGRLMSTAQMPERYQGFRLYYRKRYNIIFCEDIDEAAQLKMVESRRQRVIENWRKEYEEASKAERKEKGLTPQPTKAELAEIVESEPICVNAYLVQDGVTPRDHWWYLAISAIIGLFMLLDLALLGRWIVRFLKP